MKTFLINLDKSTERLAHMQQLLASLDISYERMPAVCGAELSQEELTRCFDAKRSLIANRSVMTPGEIGCALSHLSVYRRMMDERLDSALVFEDDIDLAPTFPEALAQAYRGLDVSRPQIVLFSDFRRPQSFQEGRSSQSFRLRREKSMACTDAYVITRPAAELICRVNFPVITCADQFRRWHRHFGLELFRCVPTTCRQMNENFGSVMVRRGSKEPVRLMRWWYAVMDQYLILKDGR